MERQRKHWLSAEQKSAIWKMWGEGQSLSAIARMLERRPSGVYRVVNKTGCIAPAVRTRSARALTLAEREEISRALGAGVSICQIALQLGRPKSTISREISRNGGSHRYRAHEADAQPWELAKRPKAGALSGNARLRRLVAAKLRLQWAPCTDSGMAQARVPGQHGHADTHETIYRRFIQERGVRNRVHVARATRSP